jgi:hypothetical protein
VNAGSGRIYKTCRPKEYAPLRRFVNTESVKFHKSSEINEGTRHYDETIIEEKASVYAYQPKRGGGAVHVEMFEVPSLTSQVTF